MSNTNNENKKVVAAENIALEYKYNNNFENNNQNLSPEEIEELARQVEANNLAFRERQRQAQLNQLRERRAGRVFRGLPGRVSWIAKARARINTKRRNAAKKNEIKRMWQTARRQYKQNVNNVANAAFTTNAEMANRASRAQAMGNNASLDQVLLNQTLKNSLKGEILAGIRRTLRNTAAAENARIYRNTKNVLLSEPRNHRQTVLKVAALDDLMVNEREKLSLASTNAEAMEAATRLYTIEQLKQELDQARHETRLPTAEQNARYEALVAGKNFSTSPTSLYRRLVNNNAAKTLAEIAKAQEEEIAAKPMIPVNMFGPAKAEGKVLGGPNGAVPTLTPEEMRAQRLARFAKKGGKKTRRNRKN